jgi:ACT domain-containing protein
MENTLRNPKNAPLSKTVVITVIGKDKVGIIASVSTALAKENMNILDISQTILQDIFTMIMLVSLPDGISDFVALRKTFDELGGQLGVSILLQHSDVYNAMHRI